MTLVRLVIHEARDVLEGRLTVSAGKVQLLHVPFQGDLSGKDLPAGVTLVRPGMHAHVSLQVLTSVEVLATDVAFMRPLTKSLPQTSHL